MALKKKKERKKRKQLTSPSTSALKDGRYQGTVINVDREWIHVLASKYYVAKLDLIVFSSRVHKPVAVNDKVFFNIVAGEVEGMGYKLKPWEIVFDLL